MNRLNFRALRADEVELRVQQVFNNDKNVPESATFLLYKDARCDMNILDEVVGSLNWKREHKRENANCVVSVWDDAKKEWVSKEDTGTESNTEAEKGLASDSFKRACFNWGIGRELYTAPQIKIAFDGNEGKNKRIYGLHVSEMVVENGQITKLVVMDNNKVRFSWSKNGKTTAAKPAAQKKTETPAIAPTPAPTPAPEATTQEQKKLATAKTKAELRAMLTDNHWVKDVNLVNYATLLAANLPE